MSQGDKPGGEKKTQMASLIPPPPSVAESGTSFKFPSPPASAKKKSGLGLPSFSPPPVAAPKRATGPVPLVPPAPPRAPVTAPPEPTVDLDEATQVPELPVTPDFARFDPTNMVDDDEDWMAQRPPGVKKSDVDEGAPTGRYTPVPEPGNGLDEEAPTQVHSGRVGAPEPETTVYSKVLKKPGIDDAVTSRYSPVADPIPTSGRKATMMGRPGIGLPTPAPVAAPEPEAPGAAHTPVVTGHTQAMDAADAPAPRHAPAPSPVSTPPAAVAQVVAAAPTPAAATRPEPVPASQPASSAKRSSLGLIVGIVAGFAVVGGIGLAIASGGGDGDAAALAAGDAKGASPAAAVTRPDEPEAAPTRAAAVETEPAAATPTEDPAQAADPEDPPVAEAPAEEPGEAAEPAEAEEPADVVPAADPEPDEAEPETEPTPPPVVDDSEAGSLLADAFTAMSGNDHRRAYDLAAKAYALEPGNESLEVMALSACHLGENPDARSAYRKLVGRTVRRRVTDQCIALGVRIHWDGEGWTSKELLKRASDALGRGAHQEAFDLAQQSQQKKRRSEAVALMAQAMCGLENGAEAQRYHDLVRSTERPAIVEACQKRGITIVEPE